MLDIVIERNIYKVMFHHVYYAKSFNFYFCLEDVPLEVIKNYFLFLLKITI